MCINIMYCYSNYFFIIYVLLLKNHVLKIMYCYFLTVICTVNTLLDLGLSENGSSVPRPCAGSTCCCTIFTSEPIGTLVNSVGDLRHLLSHGENMAILWDNSGSPIYGKWRKIAENGGKWRKKWDNSWHSCHHF